MKGFAAAVGVLFLGACASIQLGSLPSQQSDWDRALGYATQNANSGNYFAANRILDEYVRTHPDTPESREVAFWHAIYLLDPANGGGSLQGGITALDGYLAADSAGRYRNEALVLRRTAAAAQGVAALAAREDTTIRRPASGGTDTVVVVSKSREEEIASLKDQLAKSKDELAKVSAELDRIKKRLANPTK